MWRTSDWREEIRELLKLAGPLIVNNLSIAGMQFADAVMAGRLGAESLAAVAVGASVWFFGFALCLGVMMAISPIAARHYGAGNPELIGRYTRQGMYLGSAIGVVLIGLAYVSVAPTLRTIGVDESFRDLTVGYVKAIIWGGPAIFVFLALRFTTEGIGRTRPIMYASVFSLVCNVFLNYVFMFGHFGAPALGAVGCGLASAITMWLLMFVLVIYMMTSRHYAPLKIFARMAPVRPNVLREIVVLGVPIAITITAEAGLFNAVSILMGTRGAATAAAHQVAINFAATMFMIPLALSSAITVRVGHALGSGNGAAARYSGALGILVCAAFMSASAAFLLLFRDAVVGLYTSDPSVTAIAISMLLMAAIFQVADGVQIGAAGALRGYKDTRMPMVYMVISFWIVGMTLGYNLTFNQGMGPAGMWVGMIAGLTVAAALMLRRFHHTSRKLIRDQAAGA